MAVGYPDLLRILQLRPDHDRRWVYREDRRARRYRYGRVAVGVGVLVGAGFGVGTAAAVGRTVGWTVAWTTGVGAAGRLGAPLESAVAASKRRTSDRRRNERKCAVTARSCSMSHLPIGVPVNPGARWVSTHLNAW